MLKLKRVELQGFKSFCERTEMRFHGEGIAAVVGPNGCGKSNLSDGISWVLGEQSAKSLRGARMEDVIFAGTRERKPLGMAQVTMTLTDPDAAHGIPATTNGVDTTTANGIESNGHGTKPNTPPEVTITRRLYRSGESEYLIDGRLARLRDIQDLFSGTGLGPESYAIIEQGRIGQLLSSRPQDRRAVIEEAAGIGKFKTKRRLAEAKLESAKQNLSRVFDILEEVGRQANSLKRQAAKAKRYVELRAEWTTALRTALVGKFRLLEREATRVALELGEAATAYKQLNEQVAAKELEHQERQEHARRTEDELAAARERLNEFKLEAERVRGRVESQAGQAALIEGRLAEGETDATALNERLAALANDVDAHSRTLMELEGRVAEARQKLEARTRERDAAQAAVREREQGIEETRTRVLRLLGECSMLQNQAAQIESHHAALDRDKSRLQKEEQMAAADLERLNARKAEVDESLAARQLELESTSDRRRRIEADLAERKTALSSARAQLEELRAEASRLKARKDSLEEILSHRAYTAESVKSLFTAVEQGQTHGLKPLGVLADFVEVDSAYEKAAEEFLHEELEHVLVEGWGQAESGIDLVRADLDGRVTFLVHPEPNDPHPSPAAPEPMAGSGIVARLSDVLRLTNGLAQAPAALLPRLARCFVAESRADAQRLARRHPDFYFLTSEGVCYHGHSVSGGRKTGGGPLALKRELRELTSLAGSRQTLVDETALRVGTLDRELNTLGEELERLRGVQQGQERQALALDHELRQLGEEFSRSNSRISVARLELARIAKEDERLGAEREEKARVLAEKERERTAQEAALAESRESLTALHSDLHRLSEEHSVVRVELAEREERSRAELAAKLRLEQQVEELAFRQRALSQEMQRLGVERSRLLADNGELEKRAAVLAAQMAEAESGTARLAAEETAGREALATLEEALREMRLDAQAAMEKRSQIEMVLVERRAELKYLDETARKDLNAPLEELAQGAEETPETPDEMALAELEEKVASLRARIEALGAVNPDALQEYEETQRRYDFLNTQRQDLIDSIRDTEKAIQEIDVEARRRFADAFAAINANFSEMFTKLFGGGSAEMRLTDESNINDSGVDIIASPPGKRLQNVLLLSGGEKALAALSLLMAIFRYTPSPFCILDEVDAPLDEPNIQRLMGLLKEMSRQTQFIIITHARRTMEAAQALYGVTMQEAGVSKLVAVKFNPPPAENAQPAPVLAMASAS